MSVSDTHAPRMGAGQKIVGGIALLWVLLAGFLFIAAPRDEGAVDWGASMIPNGWMAWTLATAAFYWVIGALLLSFTFLAMRFPETPKVGILGIETTRGDRLFLTLLGSAFINIAWLGFEAGPQWGALLVCAAWAAAVFRLV